MRDHVQLAREQGLQGVAAIHWRTAETRYNFRTFARYARTSDDATVETLYKEYFEEDFGAQAAATYSSTTIFSICLFRSVNSISFSPLALQLPEC